MDRYKFRGKRLDNGEWVEGCYIVQILANKHHIVKENECLNPYTPSYFDFYKVDPSTVGQYTGLNDKNGKEIYEGDILLSESELLKGFGGFSTGKTTKTISKVFWDDVCWGKEVIKSETIVVGSKSRMFREVIEKFNSVIGNIHDNPSLLKGE